MSVYPRILILMALFLSPTIYILNELMNDTKSKNEPDSNGIKYDISYKKSPAKLMNDTKSKSEPDSNGIKYDISYKKSPPNRAKPISLPGIRDFNNRKIAKVIRNLTMLKEKTPPMPQLHNLRLAFLGDSLMRYQYLDLLYFLKFGEWIKPTSEPFLTYEPRHESWTKYYNFTKTIFSPEEQCDCYREEEGVAWSIGRCTENRYYWNPSTNNSLMYFQKFGEKGFKSYWNTSEIHQDHELITRHGDLKPFVVRGFNWTETINNFIAKLEPKPKVLIFNAGTLWKHEFHNASVREDVIQAIADNDMISVYKTTTRIIKQDLEVGELVDYEQELCKLADYCLDLSWTKHFKRIMFWDDIHMLDPCYSWINVALLELLSKISY